MNATELWRKLLEIGKLKRRMKRVWLFTTYDVMDTMVLQWMIMVPRNW